MERPFEIIEIDGAEHVVSLEHSFMLKVFPPQQRKVRNPDYHNIYTCIDNTIGVTVRNIARPDTLFPDSLVYDFQGIDIMFQNGDWYEPNFLKWFDAIAYYCAEKLNVKKEEIEGIAYHGEICVDQNGLRSYPQAFAKEEDTANYDFQYIEGDGKAVIVLADGSFSMSVEERQPEEKESGPVLTATLFEPFVDASTVRFNYEDWEIRACFLFKIQVCDQPMDGLMKPKPMYFHGIDYYFHEVLGTNNYQPGVPYHSYLREEY